ncbi:IS1182 family transposase [Candidatus Woesearchaeota archaeon]|nr:IS1182 family transposase [Candidatus Woesearchaeota archaeon]
MHYKKPKDRNELLLYPNIDLWIEQDNPVRLIDLVVEKFISENSDACSWGGHSDRGCTSYSPSTVLKLLMYCYFNWIPGSRRMEKETYRNIEVIWLLGDLKPDHWTICKFRRENKDLIHSVGIEFRKFLMTNGYIEGKTIVFDGSRMKAYAGRGMYSEKQLKSRIENIEQSLEKYLANMEEIDELEDRLEQESKDKDDLQKKIEKLENERDELEGLKKELKGSSKKYISPTDPDANMMKCRDGKMPCYNVQTGVDSKHHMISMAEVTTDECDFNLLKTDFNNLTDQLGFIPQEIEADMGYANIDQIKELENTFGTVCYIPLQESTSKKRDRENGINFLYDQDKDHYLCPEGKTLHLIQRNNKQRSQFYNVYKCNDCNGCPIKEKCTRSKTERSIKVNVNHQWIEGYREWIDRKENLEKVKQRKTIVEHPFGTIKMMMGRLCFLLKNKHKVQIEVDLYTTVYNLKRLINIENMDNLLKRVSGFNWKLA